MLVFQIVTIAKILLRYGMQARHIDAFVQSLLEDFIHIYDLQEKHTKFVNVHEMMSTLHMQELLHVSLRERLTGLGVGPHVIDEMVDAVMRVNYAQVRSRSILL